MIQPISIDPDLKEIAQKASIKLYGKVNLSGYISYLIREADKKKQK